MRPEVGVLSKSKAEDTSVIRPPTANGAPQHAGVGGYPPLATLDSDITIPSKIQAKETSIRDSWRLDFRRKSCADVGRKWGLSQRADQHQRSSGE